MTIDPVDGEVEPLDRSEARQLTHDIKAAVGHAWDLIVRACTGQAWKALGHSCWDGYCATEFSGQRLRLPREDQQAVVRSLHEAGLSTRAIASATGVSQSTVSRDLREGESDDSPEELAPVTGLDGKTYPPKPEPEEPDEEEPAEYRGANTKHFKAAFRLLDYDATETALWIGSGLVCDPYVHPDDLEELIGWLSVVRDHLRLRSLKWPQLRLVDGGPEPDGAAL